MRVSSQHGANCTIRKTSDMGLRFERSNIIFDVTLLLCFFVCVEIRCNMIKYLRQSLTEPNRKFIQNEA